VTLIGSPLKAARRLHMVDSNLINSSLNDFRKKTQYTRWSRWTPWRRKQRRVVDCTNFRTAPESRNSVFVGVKKELLERHPWSSVPLVRTLSNRPITRNFGGRKQRRDLGISTPQRPAVSPRESRLVNRLTLKAIAPQGVEEQHKFPRLFRGTFRTNRQAKAIRGTPPRKRPRNQEFST